MALYHRLSTTLKAWAELSRQQLDAATSHSASLTQVDEEFYEQKKLELERSLRNSKYLDTLAAARIVGATNEPQPILTYPKPYGAQPDYQTPRAHFLSPYSCDINCASKSTDDYRVANRGETPLQREFLNTKVSYKKYVDPIYNPLTCRYKGRTLIIKGKEIDIYNYLSQRIPEFIASAAQVYISKFTINGKLIIHELYLFQTLLNLINLLLPFNNLDGNEYNIYEFVVLDRKLLKPAIKYIGTCKPTRRQYEIIRNDFPLQFFSPLDSQEYIDLYEKFSGKLLKEIYKQSGKCGS